ncbi:MAG: hypothetical protein JJT95_03685 [Pararhodobacter sp.]|nr:hypothetical protein [Pararhodobacter sp.]
MRLPLALIFSTAVLASAATSASTQVISECDGRASAGNLVEPWSEHTRSYAEGAIRLALLVDAAAPECCRRYLLVLAPAGDEANDEADGAPGRQCLVVAPGDQHGFRDLDIGGVAASYSPHLGLELSVPVWLHRDGTAPDAEPFADRMILLINQETGRVRVE